MKIIKPRYQKLFTGKWPVLGLASLLLLAVFLSVYPPSSYTAAADAGISRCEHHQIDDTQGCKNRYRACDFNSGIGFGGQTVEGCRDQAIADFKASSGNNSIPAGCPGGPAGPPAPGTQCPGAGGGGGGSSGSGGNSGGPSAAEPSINRCERDDIEDTQECKRAFRKCNRDHQGRKNDRIQCKRQAINDNKETGSNVDNAEAADSGQTNQGPEGLGEVGDYICGTYENEEDNVKTKFDFGCLGTKFAQNGQGPKNISPILDLTYAFVRFLSVGVGIVIAISIIMSGIQYSMSEGNAEVTQKAKARIRSAVMGLAIYIFAFSILQFLIPGGVFSPGAWVDFNILDLLLRIKWIF